jgi:hypothetical protein
MILPPETVDHSPAEAAAIVEQVLLERQHGLVSDDELRSLLPRLRWRDSAGGRYTIGVNSRRWYAWDGRGWVPGTPSPLLRIDVEREPEPAADPMSALEESPVDEGAPPPAPTAAGYVVSAGGLPAWARPDATIPPALTLAAGTEVTVDERRGEWAHVAVANGWTGWVHAAGLVSLSS